MRATGFALLAAALTSAQFFVPALVPPAGAAGLSTTFFDYANHDIATSGAGLVDWANNGALTSSNSTGITWTRAGARGLFNGGIYNGSSKPPIAPSMTATANALIASGTMPSAKFFTDPISSDSNWTCQSPSGPVTVSGDTTTFAGAGSETNNGLLSGFTYGSSGNSPGKDDLSNVYAVSHAAPSTNEVFFGGERIVNNGDSHIDFEFLQTKLTTPNPCAAGTMSGHRTQRDLLLSTDFTNGGTLGSAQLYSWSCNGIAPGAAGYDATKDGTICDPAANGNPHSGDPQYVAVPSTQNGLTIASFGVNTGLNGITCGGWVCRNSSGAATTTLAQNALMEGGIDLNAAGFTGCIQTFVPHTRTSQSFTSVLKDFAGPIAFSNCKAPTIATSQASSNVTPGSSITVGVHSSVTDTATLHGVVTTVGGTVSYKLYTDANCTQLFADGGTKNVSGTADGNGDLALPPSNAVTLDAAGTYYWQASYSGDVASYGSNEGVTSACGDEVLTVVAPSLSITKTADAAAVSAGDSIGFTIAVHNNGAGTATSVTINDALPAGSSVDWSIAPAYAGPGTCSIAGAAPSQTLTCNLGNLAAGASASVHVTSSTARVSCGVYPNSATVAATNNVPVAPAAASTTVNCPNLSITKTADASSVSAGSVIGFTIGVSNAGPGTAKSVTLSDPLPTGSGMSWSVSPANAACSIAASTLTCSFGDLGSGASASVHITSPTAFASCATYPNTATAQATNNPAVHASATTSVQCPGLNITKTADAPTVSAGDPIGFTIAVSNTGAGTATGVTLSDPLPGGAGVSWSISPSYGGPGTCTITGSTPNQTLSCTFGDLATGASTSIHVTSGTANGSCGSFPNTATAVATNDGSAQASAGITVSCPNLSITKTADAPTIDVGSNIGFTIGVSNAGPGIARSVALNDPLPTGAGMTWSISPAHAGPGTCTIASSTLNCAFGDLAPGASTSVHVTSPTSGDTPCTTYTNTASAQATNNPAVQASASTTLRCPALQVTKTADAPTVSAGNAIGFTIGVSNTGAGTATAVTVSDPLPGGAGVSWSIDPAYGGTGTCTISGSAPNQTLSCSLGDLASASSVSVHLTGATTFASCAAYDNSAFAAATNGGGAQASATTTVECPNLSINKTADASSVSVGTNIGFTISTANAGPGMARSVTLSDPLPTGIGINWSVAPPNAACSIVNSTLTCSFGDLAPGASASVHITSGTSAGTPCTTYPNTATATAPNHPSVHASASTSVQCPGLNITKTADASAVSAGDSIGFTIGVSNTGVGTATSVTLSDPLPAGAGVSWSINPAYSGPGSCSIASSTLSCSFGDLASGASASVHVTSATSFASCRSYPNTATATATNDGTVHASAGSTVNCPDVSITKTADASTVTAGVAIGFSIGVTNSGAGTARTVALSDPLPTGAGIAWSISPAYAGPGTCSIAASTLTCAFGDLAPSASASVHVTSATTAASCATYPNTATATATNHPSVHASASTTVECASLSIVKTADASPVSAGDAIGFTVTVSNSPAEGTGIARSVTLSDPLPDGAGVSWSINPAYSGPGTCTISGSAPDQTLNCAFGDLAPSASASVHITSATSATSAGTYPNTATASATNTGSVKATATIVVLAPALAVTKTADASPVSAGDAIGFAVTVANSPAEGTGVARSVTLSDPLPSGDGVSWSINPAYSGPGSCSIASSTLSCSFGDLAPGASASVHITSATSFASCGRYPNTATATAINDGAVHASAGITVNCPTLSLTKTADASTVSAGDPIGFTISASNSGSGIARSVALSDPLPTGTGIAWSIAPANKSCSITNATLQCDFGDLAPQGSASVHITSATAAATPCVDYPNVASLTAGNHPNLEARATTAVHCPNLSIVKTADASPVSTGDVIGFTVTVSNSAAPGTGIARSVTLSDPLPSGAGVSWSINPAYAGPGTCTIAGSAPDQTLNCAFGDLAPGASASLHISSATTAASAGTYPNTATASATNTGSVKATATNTGSVNATATVVVQPPALSIVKTADAAQVDAGESIGFTMTVSNSAAEGTGIARSVTLSDPLPGGAGVSWSINPAYAGPGTCTIAGSSPNQTLNCALGDLPPGIAASVHVTSATTAASAGTYPNTATAAASNGGAVEAHAQTRVIAVTPVTQAGSTTTTTLAPVAPPSLPFTGSHTAGLVGLGLVLVASGTTLMLSRRRRRAPSA